MPPSAEKCKLPATLEENQQTLKHLFTKCQPGKGEVQFRLNGWDEYQKSALKLALIFEDEFIFFRTRDYQVKGCEQYC